MDSSKVAQEAKTIEIKSESKNTFFLIHGYTGSPTDFNGLGEYLHKRFSARVIIPRLIGHGTKVSDLDRLNYDDFLSDIEKVLKAEIDKGNNVVIGGISLGALMALDLASKYDVQAVINISTSYKFKFPINLLRFLVPLYPIKYSKKPDFNLQKRLKMGAYTYPYVHFRGFRIVAQVKKRIDKIFKSIKKPSLFIHYQNDNIIDYKGDKAILDKISSRVKKDIVFPSNGEKEHNIFYSSYGSEINKIIGDFVEESKLLK